MSTLKVLKFGSDNEAIFAMFDGGQNNEVPKLMLEKMPDILKKELSDERATDNYMKYALLSAHRYVIVVCHRGTERQVNSYQLY